MVKVKKATIAEGIEDVAILLELIPSNAIFIHSTNIPPNDGTKRLTGHLSPLDHAQTLCYIPRTNKGSTAKAIMLFNDHDLLSYFNNVGLAPYANYHNINKKPAEITFTTVSVQSHLLNSQERIPIIIDDLREKVIVSSYLSELDLELARQAEAKLLMNPYDQIPFNSKVRMRCFSNKYQFRIPAGVEITSAEHFHIKIDELKNQILQYNMNPDNTKFWCKLESQSSGTGTVQLNGLTKSEITRLEENLIDFASKCNLYSDFIIEKTIFNMREFTPFVIEIDVEEIPGNQVVSNIGVEGVISENTISLVGSVRQITNSGQYKGAPGRYIGSRIDDELMKYQECAEEAALPVFKYFWEEGYRGFATIDVLVVQTDNGLIGYNIDPNARFSGGTMLLSIVQYAEKMTGKLFYGLTYFLEVPKTANVFESICEYAGGNLYLGDNSNYKGILPLLIKDFGAVTKCNVQIAALSDDKVELEEMFRTFKSNMKKAADYRTA
jgi:hypothetical protein